MRVRKMDANDDMVFGGDQKAIWHDVPDGPAQVAKTRLKMFTNTWFLDLREGTPWQTRVLGKRTGSTRDMVIRSRILGTPGVTGIASYNSSLNRDTRGFDIAATLDTAYGTGPLSTLISNG